MKFDDVVFTRRSVRKFKDIEIDKKDILKILDIAMASPSSKNKQPWHYIVVTNKEILNKIKEFAIYYKYNSTAIIIVLADNNKITLVNPMWPYDLSATTQNILLGARSLGIGSVWCGIYPRQSLIEKITNLLDIPSNLIPFSLVQLGYPLKEKFDYISRFDENNITFID